MTRAMTSWERTESTWPWVATEIASAVSRSSSSATIFRFGLEFTALTASTVETTLASPVSSASKMITDLAFEMLVRFRSIGLEGSPLRVTIFSLPRFSVRDSISSSMNSRSCGAKMTTTGLRTFSFAIASSCRIGKIRLDQPKIRVWFASTIGLRPLRRRAKVRWIAPTT